MRAYLKELRAYHGDQAVMITEFGVPSSLGKAHLGPAGRDQGDHDETRGDGDGRRDARDDRRRGLRRWDRFEWIDEWFKLTWNTVELELPADRRQMWRNPLTNEENFGLLAAQAGLEGKVAIDGNDAEWESGEVPRR